jgi:hypothetical protein
MSSVSFLFAIRALGYVDATAGSKNDGITDILEVGHEVFFRGADENNSNVSGNGCEDSVGETCLVSCAVSISKARLRSANQGK